MKELKMPASYIAMSEQEQSSAEGGFFFDFVFAFFGPFFSGLHFNTWNTDSATLTQNQSSTVTKGNGVYTQSSGYSHTVSSGNSTSVDFSRPYGWWWW